MFVEDNIEVTDALTASIGLRYDWQNYFHDNNDFGPRASVAWAPTADHSTVLRIGGGLFHDRTGPGPISDLLHSEDGRLLRYVITNPSYPVAFTSPDLLLGQPRSLVTLAPNVTIPATWQYSAGVEQQLASALTLSATYIGMRSNNLFLSRDVNAPLPPGYAARPDPTLGVVREIESTGQMRSNALQVTLSGSLTKYFKGQTQYTLSKTQNDTGGINWFPSNDYDLSGEWGLADYDQRHRFDSVGTVKVGSWFSLGAALALYSGRPYSLLAGTDLYGNGRTNARVPGVSRNTEQGPGYADLDLRWFRDIVIGAARNSEDAPKLTLGVDAFNLLNRTNYVSYIGTVNSPLFGQPVAAQPPRRLQFSIRTTF